MKVGLVGWRGMVGSVLLRRMWEEDDFNRIKPFYFSTSVPGQTYSDLRGITHPLWNANSAEHLSQMDIIITCQGGNCSITLSLIGLAGLFKEDLVAWMSVMTYQAASGAGALYVRELLSQMQYLSSQVQDLLHNPTTPILDIIDKARDAIRSEHYPTSQFGASLAGSIIPWIDTDLGHGKSKEEWKGEVETNKILGHPPGTIGVDGLCVRIGALQSHSAAITLKLKDEKSLEEIETLIQNAHEWVEYIPNTKEMSVKKLSPVATSNSLKVAVGRLRKMSVGDNLYSVLTVGDQLLWGAAEPLRRTLNLLLDHVGT